MAQFDKTKTDNNINEISVADIVIDKIRLLINHIKMHVLKISFFGIFGVITAVAYSYITKPTYKALATFVLEDSKSGGGMGQYAGLAALAGINISSSGGGVFQGDNIIELYKSRIMIEKTLLSKCNFNGKEELLIDRYIDFNDLRNKNNIGQLNFEIDPTTFNRKQDSIITALVKEINEKVLTVSKLDKKLDIITVEVVTKDELFSKYFTEKIVQMVNDFYVQTKTKKENLNVQILQHQVDSVKKILNGAISGVASAIDSDPNANPFMLSLKVPSQKKQLDVQANTAIYGEMVKNLELAKISVRQETPLIQLIDKPVLPLMINKIGKVKAALIGFFLGILAYGSYVIFAKFLRLINSSKDKD